jgi:hypothetical protein
MSIKPLKNLMTIESHDDNHYDLVSSIRMGYSKTNSLNSLKKSKRVYDFKSMNDTAINNNINGGFEGIMKEQDNDSAYSSKYSIEMVFKMDESINTTVTMQHWYSDNSS